MIHFNNDKTNFDFRTNIREEKKNNMPYVISQSIYDFY